ncbi:hypothetical protein [Falsihalocynthiibacter sp. CO-5D18]|uniref:DUF7146 domain-containing protein n=1 Tax=Falsihalocynthiibacter sp. CO-5D18 TaxID=3240872 RepID=UPI003510616F
MQNKTHFKPDPRLEEAKAISTVEVARRLEVPKLIDNGTWKSGPCFSCGGRDRFNIHKQDGGFFCRHKCGVGGNDGIALVQQFLGVDFRAALTWLCGDSTAVVDPAELERRKKRREAEESKVKDYAERARIRARADADAIWRRTVPAKGTLVENYFALRGLNLPEVPAAIRFLPDHPYVKKMNGRFETLHRGPCMIARILDPRGMGVAVHQTWIDLSTPKGKAEIRFEGVDYVAKLVRGSMKGGVIPLRKPVGAHTLVMAEGIETTLAALVADCVPDAAYFSGISLGNLSGQMTKVKGVAHSGQPKLDDKTAFVPGPWVRSLILVQDGDSAPKMTRAKLEACILRAKSLRPGLRGFIVHAGVGIDLNDLLLRGAVRDE